ncbi:two-component sensor histidine kinase [Capnocytophaga sp. HP1101]
MKISLKNYTLRYLTLAFLLILAVWAAVFYAYILDEVYDNIDDGLKDKKTLIIQNILRHPELLKINEFGIEDFRVYPSQEDFTNRNILSNAFFYMPFDDEDEPYRVLKTGFYDRDMNPYVLEIRTSTVEKDDLLFNLAVALGVLYVVLVLSMYLINLLLINKIWKPFKKIVNAIQQYEVGNKAALQPIHTEVIEFNVLHDNIKQMWQRNEAIFEEQKTFIENASHELQTPLAITLNKLELLTNDPTLSEKQLVQLSELKQSLMRMTHLNKSLLMLTRIENHQYKQSEKVSFTTLTANITEDLSDLIAFKKLNVTTQAIGDFQVEMNNDLATVLVSNLLRNAIKYAEKEGEIQVLIKANRFQVKNTAKNNLRLDGSKIFQRFHKGQQDASSTGLGLAIVKSIVDSYQLSICYSFEEGMHCFTLKKI